MAQVVRLAQVADVTEEPSEVELVRDDLRQDIIVSARLEGRDLGSAMKEIQDKLSQDKWLPPGTVQYGGLYQQQQESFRNLMLVLLAAILLVFTVLLVEFRSFNEPVAIVFGAILAMFGTIAALWLTGITLNIVSFLGAIIGVGIVAKNGILMLDFVQQLESDGVELTEAAGALRPSPFAAGADDLARRRAGDAAAGLGHRLRRGDAAPARHRGHRRALHLRAAVAHRNARGLLHLAADYDPLKSSMTGCRVKPRVLIPV